MQQPGNIAIELSYCQVQYVMHRCMWYPGIILGTAGHAGQLLLPRHMGSKPMVFGSWLGFSGSAKPQIWGQKCGLLRLDLWPLYRATWDVGLVCMACPA